jgi:hypothetical protein
MKRITEKDLQAVVDRINRTTGSPMKWGDVGNYQLDGAYGGWRLVRVVNKSGGVTDITSGYRSKRDVYDLMHSWLRGWEAGSNQG